MRNQTYIGSIINGLKSSWKGLMSTLRHLRKGYKTRTPIGIEQAGYFSEATGKAGEKLGGGIAGNVTIQYPKEKIPVPDLGRYRLHMETDDCIVCDKCARICPVDCIEIESFKAVDDLGYTSDGSKKRLELPVFDIDMAKCCFCGLCTTVCPTECLAMTKVYDYSEYDRRDFIYHFGGLSPEEAISKRKASEELQLAKKRTSATASVKKPLNKKKFGKPVIPPKKEKK